jgi:opacity protein-like surface antigen
MTPHLRLILFAATVAIVPSATAQAADKVVTAPSRDPVWYARVELGAAWIGEDSGYWWGPGGPPSDPRITFDLDNSVGWTGAIAIGRSFMPGVRGDISIGYTGGHEVDANWISASDGSPGPHADIDTRVSAFVGLANIFLEPLAMSGNGGPIQPFVTAGIGFANTSMDEWTRTNAAAARPVRRWSAGDDMNFAWTVGAGVSADASQVFNRPAYLDVTYRYSDFGNVQGGSVPTFPGPPPNNSPTESFNFDYRTHAVTVGLRVPFGS